MLDRSTLAVTETCQKLPTLQRKVPGKLKCIKLVFMELVLLAQMECRVATVTDLEATSSVLELNFNFH